MKKYLLFQNILLVFILVSMGCVEDTKSILRPEDVKRPEKPTGLQATATNTAIHLKWNSNIEDDLKGYAVYRSTESDSGFALIRGELTETAYTDSSGLLPETMYYYSVTAEDQTGNESLHSDVASATLITKQYSLTLSANNSDWGKTKPSAGTHTYNDGTVVTVTALPEEGYRFVNWTGAVSNPNSAETTVAISSDITVTAVFEKAEYSLSIDTNKSDWGTTTPATGMHYYPEGTEVTLTATPAEGYRFVRWTGNVASSNSPSTSITLEENETVTAIFEEVPPGTYVLTLQVNQAGWGTTYPSAGTHIYQDGSIVDITAIPAEGYRFVEWVGDVDDADKAATAVTVSADITVTATFEKAEYTLAVEVYKTGWGTTSPIVGTHTYQEGTEVPITATPSENYRFVRWTGNVDEPNNPVTSITIMENETVTAIFEEVPPDMNVLSMQVNQSGWGTTSPIAGTHTYEKDAKVPINAIPAPGYRFIEWTGGVDEPGSASTTVTISSDMTVTAHFEKIPPVTYTLTMEVNAPGQGTTAPAAGEHEYDEGTVVSISAAPVKGYRFLSWTGDVANANSASTTAVVNGNMTVTANFEEVEYTLKIEVNQSGWGTTSPEAGTHTYQEGTEVSIAAFSTEGYRFVRWTGNVASPNSPSTSIILEENETVTAIFEEIPVDMYILTMQVNQQGWGSTTPSAGTHIYKFETEVTITATPAQGYRFVGWTGNVANANNATTSTTITGNKTVTAVFELIPPVTYDLVMEVNQAGWGSTTPAPGTHSYVEDTSVTITANPSTGYRFVNWTGDVTNPTNSTTTTTMNSDKTVTANFDVINRILTMAVNQAGWGTTTPLIGQTVYSHGTVVTITATPAAGYRFVNWTGDVATVNNVNTASTTVTMDANLSITANYELIPRDLTMAVNQAGWGTTTPAIGLSSYDNGTIVNISATPTAGYQFVNWTGDVANTTAASTTVTMNADKTVTANFEPIPRDLTMAVNNAAWGSTTPVTGVSTHDNGTDVNITATPEAGYEFVSWTGDVADANAASTTVTMDADKTVTANFAVIQYDLTLAVTPVDTGTTSPAVGAHTYDINTVVPITATPVAGYQFVNWTGDTATVDDVNAASTTVTMTADLTVTANFEPIPRDLTMAVNNAAWGSTTPAAGVSTYDNGTDVNIIATPEAGYEFVSWTGDVADANAASTTVTMDADKTVTANFAVIQYDLTLAVTPVDTGTTNPAVGAHTYDINTVVPIAATPVAGYQFVNWTGDVGTVDDVNAASTTITMSADLTITANFEPIPRALTMAVNDAAWGSTTPAAGVSTYDNGTDVNIIATPEAGYEFVSWTGDVADANAASTTVTMDADKTVTANFAIIQYDLTMAATPIDGGTTNPAVGAHPYDINTVVPIMATPVAGYQFVNWTGDVGTVDDVNAASTTVTMTADLTVTANFEPIPRTLTMVASPVDGGTTDPVVGVSVHDNGTVVNLTATPEAGYVFDSWTGNVDDVNSATTTITMTADETVTANFIAE